MPNTLLGELPNVYSREKFLVIIDKIRRLAEFEDKLSELYHSYYYDISIDVQTFQDELIDSLEVMFMDDHHFINYFVYDLNFGEYYTDECLTRYDSSDLIDISNADKLYDYLAANLLQKFSKHEDLDK